MEEERNKIHRRSDSSNLIPFIFWIVYSDILIKSSPMEKRARASGLQSFLYIPTNNWVWVKINHKGTTGFSPAFHLPGFHLGYLLLTHSQLDGSPGLKVGAKWISQASTVTLGVKRSMGIQDKRLCQGIAAKNHNT